MYLSRIAMAFALLSFRCEGYMWEEDSYVYVEEG